MRRGALYSFFQQKRALVLTARSISLSLSLLHVRRTCHGGDNVTHVASLARKPRRGVTVPYRDTVIPQGARLTTARDGKRVSILHSTFAKSEKVIHNVRNHFFLFFLETRFVYIDLTNKTSLLHFFVNSVNFVSTK